MLREEGLFPLSSLTFSCLSTWRQPPSTILDYRYCTSVSFIRPTSNRMSSQKPVYLLSAWKGRAVTQHEKRYPCGVVVEHAGFKDVEQKWLPEFGEEPDTVAIKSVANGEYLTAPAQYYKDATTGEKTWWKMSYDEVRIPGAFRLSFAGSPEKTCLEHQNVDCTEAKLSMTWWIVCSSYHFLYDVWTLC